MRSNAQELCFTFMRLIRSPLRLATLLAAGKSAFAVRVYRQPAQPVRRPRKALLSSLTRPSRERLMLDRKLLDLLVCPVSRGPLTPDPSGQELLCLASALAYPVRDGLPVLLEDQARPLTAAEIEQLRLARR
jgi:uncharacterized protein YbaR (Trm112 family)